MSQVERYRPHIGAPRVKDNEEDPQERAKDFRPCDRGFTEQMAEEEAYRCLNCKKPLCVQGCPVNINIPAFIAAIREKDYGKGLDIIHESSLLPAICGRVCPQESQCEGSCIVGKKSDPVAIGQLERFLGDMPTQATSLVCKPKRHKKVAIVGCGPSGIACASELVQEGFDVEVFEALFKGGGVLSYGIPEFRLPAEVIERELKQLEDLGVTFTYNAVIGRMLDAQDLFDEGFEAIYIAVGAGLPKLLHIPGENLPNVYFANEYLTRINLMGANTFPAFDTPIKRSKHVVVFGGGNVAMDAVRCAVRLGAQSVTLCYRRTEAEMPARKAEIAHAKAEGVIIRELVSPVACIAGDNGYIQAVKLQHMQLGDPDENGRRRPVACEGSYEILPCDCAISAIGTKANPFASLIGDIACNEWGYIQCDEDGRTSHPKIWAGGDIVTGAATVILAMGAGKKAAQSIVQTLS